MAKHNSTCNISFGKPSKHSDCPRCEELKNGAAPVKWNNRKVAQRQDISTNHLNSYCFSVSIYHDRCTKENNPTCACGKRPYCN